MWEDPLRQTGFRPEHDLTDAAVRNRLLDLASAPLEPQAPNVWQFGAPCTTFCDFQLWNGGTRTFDQPGGTGERPDEQQGNAFAQLAADLCLRLHSAGREFCFESSAASGRYPKIWDLPCVRKLRKRTGAMIVPMHMCTWYLTSEECRPCEYHRRPTWWLVSPGLYPWVRLFLLRKCPGVSPTHVHSQLKGSSPTVPGVPRTRVAQQYSVPLCAAWGLAVRAAFAGWSWPEYLAGKQTVRGIALRTARARKLSAASRRK